MDASLPQDNPTPGFSSLSDDLLCQVFSSLVGSSELHVLPRVCQRWNAAISSSRCLLWCISFDPAARGVSEVDASTCSFLLWLQSRRAYIWAFDCAVYSCTATADVLQQFDRLRWLSVQLIELTDLQPLFEAIGSLPMLEKLRICGEPWTANIKPLQNLTSLVELSLDIPCYLDLASLSVLQELTHADLSGSGSQPEIVPGLNVFLQSLSTCLCPASMA